MAVGSAGMAPNMLDGMFILGFIAAAIGGLESPLGALVAGVAIGTIMQFIDDYMNSNYANFVAVILLVLVLMVRPQGLFAKNTDRRV
jgi:branched-chain amino acid transport system permease protein